MTLNKEQLSTLFEIAGNFHLHTTSSDGTVGHRQVAAMAAQSGLDVIICTDHNVWVPGVEGRYTHPETAKEVLLLMGEEVHDEERSPQVNHYLCLGVDRELRAHAARPQALIDAVSRHGGLGFIAHPVERAAPLFDEPEDIGFGDPALGAGARHLGQVHALLLGQAPGGRRGEDKGLLLRWWESGHLGRWGRGHEL